MVKPGGKTKKTTQARLSSIAKTGIKGQKRSASSKNIPALISKKQKKSQGSSSNTTNLAAARHDNDTDSIVDQDDDDHVVQFYFLHTLTSKIGESSCSLCGPW